MMCKIEAGKGGNWYTHDVGSISGLKQRILKLEQQCKEKNHTIEYGALGGRPGSGGGPGSGGARWARTWPASGSTSTLAVPSAPASVPTLPPRLCPASPFTKTGP